MLLNETQRQIRDMAREFARQKADRPRRHHATRLMLFRLGFLGMMVPEAYGGSNIGAVAYSVVLEEIAVGDGAFYHSQRP